MATASTVTLTLEATFSGGVFGSVVSTWSRTFTDTAIGAIDILDLSISSVEVLVSPSRLPRMGTLFVPASSAGGLTYRVRSGTNDTGYVLGTDYPAFFSPSGLAGTVGLNIRTTSASFRLKVINL